MQKSMNIFFKAALAVLAIMSAAGCITEKLDTSDGLQSVMLQVNIEAGEITKADLTPEESAINSVRIYAYRSDGTPAGHYYRAEVSDDPIIMDLTLPETGIHDVNFHIIANEESMVFDDGLVLTESLTQTQLQAAKIHNVNPSFGLPMYCVQDEAINVDNVSQTANTAAGHEGHFYLAQQVSFKLIRPMAKVSVYAAIADGGAPGSISVSRVDFPVNGTRIYNYLLPQTDAVLAAVPLRTDGVVMSSNSVTLTKTVDKTDASEVENPANYDLVVGNMYIAETEAGDANWQTRESDRQALLHVEYSVGDGGEIQHGYVYLPKIVRNHHYKVCILINSEGSIIINYYVADWDDADMTELWFDYPSHSYLRVAPNETDTASDPASMSTSQPFTGYFKLSYPADETWRPVLLTNAAECEVKVYKGEDTTPMTYPIAADSENWYKITVTPSASLSAGTEVELAITYSPLGSMDKYEYLMINGSQSNPYWPYSGTSDPNKIIIKVN